MRNRFIGAHAQRSDPSHRAAVGRIAPYGLVLLSLALASPPLFADTVINANDNGSGSLRATIAAASPGATIDFAAGVTGAVQLSSPLVVGKDLTIAGPGAQVLQLDGQAATRVLEIQSGATVTVSGLTIRGGFVKVLQGNAADGADGTKSGDGGPGDPGADAVAVGGGILNQGHLTILGCALQDNGADAEAGHGGTGGNGGSGEGGGAGGAGGKGGDARAEGGAIYSTGTGAFLEVRDSTFGNNAVGARAGDGGAGGAGGDGEDGGAGDGGDGGAGGIRTQRGAAVAIAPGGSATLVNCTITNNDIGAINGGGAGGLGGAGGSAPTGGEFGGPGGDGGRGGASGDAGSFGAVYTFSPLRLSHVTLAANRGFATAAAPGAGGPQGDGAPAGADGASGDTGLVGGPIANLAEDSLTGGSEIDRSIVANPTLGTNFEGTVLSGGYNVSFGPNPGDDFGGLLDQATDRAGVDPQLAAAAINVPGSTLTMAISPSSPAHDLIPAAACTEATDQRGVIRPQGNGCDSGAFELEQAVVVPTLGGVGFALLAALLAAAGLAALRRG